MAEAIGDKQVLGHGTPVGFQSYFPTDPEPAVAGPEDEVQVDDTPDEDVDESNATEAAVELAAELDVDLDEVEGSGADGRITAPDVEDAAAVSDDS